MRVDAVLLVVCGHSDSEGGGGGGGGGGGDGGDTTPARSSFRFVVVPSTAAPPRCRFSFFLLPVGPPALPPSLSLLSALSTRPMPSSWRIPLLGPASRSGALGRRAAWAAAGFHCVVE